MHINKSNQTTSMLMKQLISNKTVVQIHQSDKQQREGCFNSNFDMNKTEQMQSLQTITKHIVSKYSTSSCEQILQGYAT